MDFDKEMDSQIAQPTEAEVFNNDAKSPIEIPTPYVLKVSVYPYPDRQIISFQDVKFWFSGCNPLGAILAKEKGQPTEFSYVAYVFFPDFDSHTTALTCDKNMISSEEYLVVHDSQNLVDVDPLANVSNTDLLLKAVSVEIRFEYKLNLSSENIFLKSKFRFIKDIDESIPARYRPRKRTVNPEFPLAIKSFTGALASKNTEAESTHPSHGTHNKVDVQILVPEDYPYELPKYATAGSAGFDILAHIPCGINILPGQVTKVGTGLRVAIPPGYELQIRSKSGLALNSNAVVANSPGTIDSDYHLEIGVLILNVGKGVFKVEPGMKVAQGVLCPVYQANFVKISSVDEFPGSERKGGFGSTGLF